MKDTCLMMLGAAAGISIYMGVCSSLKNKKELKKKIDNFIDCAADNMN